MRRRTVPSGNGPIGDPRTLCRLVRTHATEATRRCAIPTSGMWDHIGLLRRRPRSGCRRENSNLLATARSTATRDYECSTGAAARSSRLRLTRSRSPHDPAKEWSAALLKRLHEAPQLRRHADKSAALDGLSLTSRISSAINVARAEGASFSAGQAGARDRSARKCPHQRVRRRR